MALSLSIPRCSGVSHLDAVLPLVPVSLCWSMTLWGWSLPGGTGLVQLLVVVAELGLHGEGSRSIGGPSGQ